MDKRPTTKSEEGRAARPRTRKLALLGLAVVFLVTSVFLGWSAWAPLDSAALAPGTVIVESKRKTVKHLEGGIVEKILVQEGDPVAMTQALIVLDETQARARLALLRTRYMLAAALAARLVAERDSLAEVDFPDWLDARRDEPRVLELLHAQRNIFAARRETILSEIAILEQRDTQIAEEIKGLQEEIAAQDKQLVLLAEEIVGVQTLFEKGLMRKPRVLELQRRAAAIEGLRGQNRANIARARQAIGETQLRITNLHKELRNEVVAELRDVQADLLALEEQIRAAEDVLQRTVITAPMDGTVVGLQVHTPGGVIAAGEPLLDIVPSGDRLIIEAQVNPEDIEVVNKGLEARVRLTAFNSRHVAPLQGRVISVSADRLIEEGTRRPYYLARVELAADPAAILGETPVAPGMSAEVLILTGQRTPLDYFLEPITRSFWRAFRES
jgi:HlyD family type I secretion membrane fusion protein